MRRSIRPKGIYKEGFVLTRKARAGDGLGGNRAKADNEVQDCRGKLVELPGNEVYNADNEKYERQGAIWLIATGPVDHADRIRDPDGTVWEILSATQRRDVFQCTVKEAV